MSFHFTYILLLLDILFDLHLEVDLLVSETPKQLIKLSCEHQVSNMTTSISELYENITLLTASIWFNENAYRHQNAIPDIR